MTAVDSRSARIRRQLDHPVIDGDGHWVEPMPVLLEYLREIAGPRLFDQVRNRWADLWGRGAWYDATPARRLQHRITRPPWWTLPANTLDRATTIIPGLLHRRLEEFGIDFSIIYPSAGLYAFTLGDEEIRRAFSRALNTMTADLFRPYRDRLAPVAVVPTHSPREAVEEAQFAVEHLGMKAICISGTIRRPISADHEWQPDPAKRRHYVDAIGLDSEHDYDPLWAKCVDLGVAVTTHVGSMGWMDRSSPNNFVSNHLGHFAQAGHCFARSLFLGGVTERFPSLNFGFLEGGVGWGCNLLSDLTSHWKKRNKRALDEHLMPTRIDREALRRLFERYAADPLLKKLDEIVDLNLVPSDPSKTLEELTARDRDADDFAAVSVNSPQDVQRTFSKNFYFGCEADDPMTAWAFDARVNRTVLKPVFSSDIAHFDVTDIRAVLEEAYELVEQGLLDQHQFRSFTFSNIVSLHGAMNPRFFEGTVVETAAGEEVARLGPAMSRDR